MCGYCSRSRSGRDGRSPLYSLYTSRRPLAPLSHTTTVGLGPRSVISFTSIDAKPKIALVGKPVEVAIDSGSAKNARYTSELPSIRKSSLAGPSVDTACTVSRSARAPDVGHPNPLPLGYPNRDLV